MTDPEPTPQLSRPRRVLRWCELLAVFFALPGVVAMYADPRRRFDFIFDAIGADALIAPGVVRFRFLLPALIAFSILIFVVLLADRGFENRKLWNWRACKRALRTMTVLFLALAAATLALTWILHEFTDFLITNPGGDTPRSAFLGLALNRPEILVFIAIGYPWFSAYPQEVTHRAFFFHRYRAILPAKWALIGVNVLAFSWLHAPFWNPAALIMTALGGVLFAWTYERTRSTLAAAIEHSLYGWWMFFTGLGWFVYAGSLGG